MHFKDSQSGNSLCKNHQDMSSSEEEIYFYYPISFNQKAFENITKVADDAIDYAIYAQSAKYDHEDLGDRMKAAANFFKVGLNSSYDFSRGETVYKRGGRVMTSVSKTIIFNFRGNKKTEFEIACYCAFTGLKSILGKKPFAKITNAYFIARMFGFHATSEMSIQIQRRELVQKYSHRYHLDRIKNELIENWGLKLYARSMRGFYVSFSTSYEDLVRYAEKNRPSRQLSIRKAQERQVVQKILAEF